MEQSTWTLLVDIVQKGSYGVAITAGIGCFFLWRALVKAGATNEAQARSHLDDSKNWGEQSKALATAVATAMTSVTAALTVMTAESKEAITVGAARAEAWHLVAYQQTALKEAFDKLSQRLDAVIMGRNP